MKVNKPSGSFRALRAWLMPIPRALDEERAAARVSQDIVAGRVHGRVVVDVHR